MIESTENIGALQSKFTDVELFNLLTKPHKTPHEKLLIDVEVAVRNLENATTDTDCTLAWPVLDVVASNWWPDVLCVTRSE